MSALSSRYPSLSGDLDSTVFSDGSDPYAEAEFPGLGVPKPYWARIEPHSAGHTNNSRAQLCKKRHRQLRATNRKLRRRNKRLAVQLVSMVMLAIVTVIPLFVQIPLLRTRLFFWATSASTVPETSKRSGGAYPCVDVTQGFSEELLGRCKVPDDDDDGCIADVNKVVCIMTKTREDLDRRTQKLDREIDEHNKWIESQVGTSAHNISDIYSHRPTFHFFLSHSYDSNTAKPNNGLPRLRWKPPSGLSYVRDMEVNEPEIVTEVTVTHPGYYYVYSHVTYKPSTLSISHMIYKNNRCGSGGCSGNGRKLLESVRVFSKTQHVSFLQGVFLLRPNDTLSVLADLGHINTRDLRQRKRTFFGAFRI